MPKHGKQILAEALKLPPVERAELVEDLLSSFEFQSRGTIDALWAQEAEDRIDAFERGEMSTIPAKEVFAEIEKNRPQ
jgi:putative addiction module component (TIGR02574 family)